MTKRLRFAVVLAAILCLTVAGAMSFGEKSRVTYAEDGIEGLWTEVSNELPPFENGEYHVSTPAQFGAFVKKWNDGIDVSAGGIRNDAKVVIDNSLDFSGRYFVPLGTDARPFTGEIRGNAYTFKGISYVEGDADHKTAAIVAVLGRSGVVQQIGVVADTDLSGYQYAAGIVGTNMGVVHSCIALNTRYATRAPMTAGGVVGGIVALNYGRVYNVYAGGSITLRQANTELTYGGVVGKNNFNSDTRGLLAYSYSTEVTDWAGYEPQNAGGVAGSSYTATGETFPDSIWYSYYRKEVNLCQTAVGGKADDAAKQVYPLSDAELGTNDYRTMFPSSSNEVDVVFGFAIPINWSRSLTSEDGSSYYAPVLNGFHQNSREENAAVAQIRRYGIKADGEGAWGSEKNPFLIGTVTQWKAFAENVNRNITYQGKFFELTDNLDFDGDVLPQAGGHMMSNGDRTFRGTFDGKNNRFVDFRLEATEGQDYTGIFGYVDREGTVKNVEVTMATVSGMRYVGVLVGYLTGKLENVRVYNDVSVTGNAYLGGVVGESRAGSLKNVLSETQMTPPSSATHVYGIAGASVSSEADCCWYVTDSASAYLDAGCGASLIVDVNGTVSVAKTDRGNISFTARGNELETNVRWSPEYRTEREETLQTDPLWQVYEAGRNVTGRVFVRFMKNVTFGTDDYGLELATESGRYYQGQTATVLVKALNGYYLSDVSAYRIADGASDEDPNVIFSFLTDRDGIRVAFTVNKEVRSVYVTPERVNAPSVVDQNNERLTDGGAILYDGTPVKYEYKIDGYQINYNWSNGAPPVNVGNGTYTLTVSVMLDGVQRGYERQTFTIAKRPVTVTEEALTKVKEFDGRQPDSFVILPVDTSKVEGLIAGDSVFINSRAYFSSNTVSRTSIRYEFILSGAASGNYRIGEDSVNEVDDGEIVKKTVVILIQPENLKKVYDAGNAAIASFGYYGSYEPIQEYPMDPRFRFVRTHDANGNIYGGETLNFSDAGKYRPEVYDAGNYKDYYNLMLYPEFLESNGQEAEYYEYVIERAKVKVTFTNYENREYTGSVQSISGYYYGTGASHTRWDVQPEEIEYLWEDMPENYTAIDQMTQFLNAGWYTATLKLNGNYVADSDNGADTVRFYVKKVRQESMVLQFTEGTSYTYGCAPVPMHVNEAENAAGMGEFGYNITGYARVVEGNKLDFTGGGEVTVYAYRQEGINYLSNRSNSVTLTVKKLNLQVALKDATVKYGDPVEFQFEYRGLAERDKNVSYPAGFTAPTVYVNGVAHKNNTLYDVDTYTISLSATDTATSNGYEIVLLETEKELTITRRTLQVVANTVEQVYGEYPVPLSYTVYEDGEEIAFLLNGTLFRPAGNTVGNYPVTQGTVTAENNPNVDFTFEEGTYRIVPRTLTMVVKPMRKTYGQPDPVPKFEVSGLAMGELIGNVVSGQITREPGENAYTDTTDYGFYRYLSTGLTVNENYTLNFVTVNGNEVGNLYIDPAEPKFGEIWHGEIAYGDALNTIFANGTAKGVKGETLFGEFTWANPETVPDFGSADELQFEIIFTPQDRNYTAKSSSAILSLKKQEIGVRFRGSASVTYNGKAQTAVTYTFTGTEETPDCEAVWSATPLNAGTYTLTVTLTEKRFVLKGENTFTLTIKPAVLEIGVKDVTYTIGETPDKEFTYSGFVNGESEKNLTALPDVRFHDAAGNYTVTPFGAASANYTIRYIDGREIVLKPETATEGFVWQGKFSADTAVTVTACQEDDEAYTESRLEWLKVRIGQDFAKYEISALYSVSLTSAADSNVYGKVGFTLPENVKNLSKMGIVVFKKDGTAEFVKFEREGDVVWFDASDMAYFAVVAPASYTLYYIIGGVAVAVVVLLIVGIILLRRGLRIKKEREEERILADYDPNMGR